MAICFAILAHRNRESLKDLLLNLRHFCPGCIPVVYDASRGNTLSPGFPALVYPAGKKLAYGRGGHYILDVMEWALSINLDFDFFVVLDSDVLFIQEGYEDFLRRELASSEYAAVEFRPVPDPKTIWGPAQTIWSEWRRWRALLKAQHPFGAFNPGQAFRKTLVDRIANLPEFDDIRRALSESRQEALAEVVFPTLAYRLNGKPKPYPNPYPFAVSHRPLGSVSLCEVLRFRQDPNCHMIHPVKPLDVNHPVRSWVRSFAGYGQNEESP